MEIESEIERLRAALIVDRAVIQSMLDAWPAANLPLLAANVEGKLEQFTVRSLNSTMPEAFFAAQQEHAEAWLSVLRARS
ncbi:hypothetical protein [Methylibium sp.]|uniref:hypothetical protein n=1 Tax=Methylibium sp. TaxID=2067992 RepID=UPI003D117385